MTALAVGVIKGIAKVAATITKVFSGVLSGQVRRLFAYKTQALKVDGCCEGKLFRTTDFVSG